MREEEGERNEEALKGGVNRRSERAGEQNEGNDKDNNDI